MFNRKLRERMLQLTDEVWRLRAKLNGLQRQLEEKTTIFPQELACRVETTVVVEALLKAMGWKINVTPPRDGKIELIDKDS